MRAIVQRRYGGPEVLTLDDWAEPVVGADDVLIGVRAAAVSAGDVFLVRGTPSMVRAVYGVRHPRNPVVGRDIAGEVVAVGENVTRFRPGDAVYCESDGGGYAELAAVPEKFVAAMPTTVDFTHAAAVPVSGATALQGMRLGEVGPGRRVLVNGASGGVGGFAVQIAKARGAEVTGVCRGDKSDHVRALGADHVIDHTREDFTETGGHYDLIFDLAANRPLGAVRRALTRRGVLVLSSGTGGRVFGPMGRIMRAAVVSPFVSQRLRPLAATRSADDLAELAGLIDSGAVTPAVDRTYPLDQAREAFARFESGEVRGKLVLVV